MAGACIGAVDGQNLLPVLLGMTRAGDPERPAYTESSYQHVLPRMEPLRAVRTGRWKFIEAPRPELYDLESDPGELQQSVDDRAALASGLQRALPSLGTVTRPSAARRAGEAAERLRSLGYVVRSTIPRRTRARSTRRTASRCGPTSKTASTARARPARARSRRSTRALRLDPATASR
jgi:hypothetical protein